MDPYLLRAGGIGRGGVVAPEIWARAPKLPEPEVEPVTVRDVEEPST